MDNAGMWDVRRLDETEISIYRWASREGWVDVPAAAATLNLPPEEVQQAVEALVKRHLLRTAPAGPGEEPRVVPVAPQAAAASALTPAETFLRNQLARAEELRSEYDFLESVFAEGRQATGAGATAHEVRDLKTVVDLIDDALARCQEEVLACEPSREQPYSLIERAYAGERGALQRGVRMHTLYQHTARYHDATQRHVDRLLASGAQVRTLSDLFGRMVAFDRRTVFIPHHEEPDGAVIISDPATVSYLCSVFDHAWVLATPYRPGHLSSPSLAGEAKQAIVRLLTEGMKDEVIARRLGMSVRTCRKHIAEIMETFGAESRFQVGYLIRARLGEPGTTTADLDHVIAPACSSGQHAEHTGDSVRSMDRTPRRRGDGTQK